VQSAPTGPTVAAAASASQAALYALGAEISGRTSPEKSHAVLAWALRNDVAHPLAEHLLCMNPPRNASEAASTLLAAVKTQKIATVRLVLGHIAVRPDEGGITSAYTLHSHSGILVIFAQ